jgi:hypothetical protein
MCYILLVRSNATFTSAVFFVVCTYQACVKDLLEKWGSRCNLLVHRFHMLEITSRILRCHACWDDSVKKGGGGVEATSDAPE